jgi:hypothetical protein
VSSRDARRLRERPNRREITMTNLASDNVTLETVVARLNIEHYRKRLTEEVDETKRQTLLELIAEETTKLSALSPMTAT